MVTSVSDDDEVRFEWDDEKASANLERHKVPLEAAAHVFDDPSRLEEDDRFAQGEYRTIAIGRVDGLHLTIVYTEPEENVIRLISARRSTAAERKAYDQNLFPA